MLEELGAEAVRYARYLKRPEWSIHIMRERGKNAAGDTMLVGILKVPKAAIQNFYAIMEANRPVTSGKIFLLIPKTEILPKIPVFLSPLGFEDTLPLFE